MIGDVGLAESSPRVRQALDGSQHKENKGCSLNLSVDS